MLVEETREKLNLSFPFNETSAITERLLQFIWQFQYFNKGELQTTTGEELQIISQGT